MKKIVIAIFFGATLTIFGSESLELGLLSPTQLYGPQTDVNGVRVGLIYTENNSVEGLDLNILANRKKTFKGVSLGSFYDRTDGDFTGVRLGWFVPLTFNSVGGNMTGVQWGLVNMVGQHMTGVQGGAINFTNTGKGVQFGLFNKANRMRGLQLGFVNMVEHLEGLQIGIVNIADNSEVFDVLPILNFNFKF